MTALVLLGVIPAVPEMPALGALFLVAAVCGALVVYDVFHYRDERRLVRQSRWQPSEISLPTFTAEAGREPASPG